MKNNFARSRLTVAAFVVATFAFSANAQSNDEPAQVGNEISLTRLEGNLGSLPEGLGLEPRRGTNGGKKLYELPPEAVALLGGKGTERWSLRKWSDDDKGKRHYRMRQVIDSMEVVGGEIIVHADNATGRIESIDLQFLSAADLPATPLQKPDAALSEILKAEFPADVIIEEEPQLTYLRAESGKGYLAWRARVRYQQGIGFELIDDLFVDTQSGKLVERHAQAHSAQFRRVYTANNTTSLPGTQLIAEGGSSTDPGAQAAYTHMAGVYSYYLNTHARDSWDGSGGEMKATVHYGVNVDDAYWTTGNRTWYGDGNGTTRGPFHVLDVVGHEFTHGVVQDEAGLSYQNEPGAINEGMGDIFGSMVERYQNGLSAATWKFGDRVTRTAGTPNGFGIRSLSAPKSIASYYEDYYPQRYQLPGGTSPGPANDYGGVHWNAGIPGLAFYLMSQGGTHPRGMTSISVPAVGYSVAEQIFYKTLRDHLLSNDGFSATANKMAAYAKPTYGGVSAQLKSVCAAWQAVGVPHNKLNCPDANATLLPPATVYVPHVASICYGVNDISWSGVSGATSYKVVKSSLSGDFTVSSTIATPTGVVTLHNMGNNNSIAYVRVAACNVNGCSALSSAVGTLRGTTFCN